MTCSSNENDLDGPDEFDVDMTPEGAVSSGAEVDCLGTYPSLEAFVRGQVEHLLLPEGTWLLDCLDVPAVLRALEAGTHHIWRSDDGRVFRRPADPD